LLEREEEVEVNEMVVLVVKWRGNLWRNGWSREGARSSFELAGFVLSKQGRRRSK